MGAPRVPGISGFTDGARAPHHVRSSRYRPVGPRRISAQHRGHGGGYRHRAAGGGDASRRAVRCIGMRAGLHQVCGRSIPPRGRSRSVRFIGQGLLGAGPSVCVARRPI